MDGRGEALARAFVEAFNDRDVNRIFAELVTEDVVLHDLGFGIREEGASALREATDRTVQLFPDARYEAEPRFIDGGHHEVAMVYVWRGTAAAAVFGLEVGDQLVIDGCAVLEVRDGRIARLTDYTCRRSVGS